MEEAVAPHQTLILSHSSKNPPEDSPTTLSVRDDTIDSRASPIPSDEIFDAASPIFEYYEEIKFKSPVEFAVTQELGVPFSTQECQTGRSLLEDVKRENLTVTYHEDSPPLRTGETVVTTTRSRVTITKKQRIIRRIVVIDGVETVVEEIVEDPEFDTDGKQAVVIEEVSIPSDAGGLAELVTPEILAESKILRKEGLQSGEIIDKASKVQRETSPRQYESHSDSMVAEELLTTHKRPERTKNLERGVVAQEASRAKTDVVKDTRPGKEVLEQKVREALPEGSKTVAGSEGYISVTPREVDLEVSDLTSYMSLGSAPLDSLPTDITVDLKSVESGYEPEEKSSVMDSGDEQDGGRKKKGHKKRRKGKKDAKGYAGLVFGGEEERSETPSLIAVEVKSVISTDEPSITQAVPDLKETAKIPVLQRQKEAEENLSETKLLTSKQTIIPEADCAIPSIQHRRAEIKPEELAEELVLDTRSIITKRRKVVRKVVIVNGKETVIEEVEDGPEIEEISEGPQMVSETGHTSEPITDFSPLVQTGVEGVIIKTSKKRQVIRKVTIVNGKETVSEEVVESPEIEEIFGEPQIVSEVLQSSEPLKDLGSLVQTGVGGVIVKTTKRRRIIRKVTIVNGKETVVEEIIEEPDMVDITDISAAPIASPEELSICDAPRPIKPTSLSLAQNIAPELVVMQEKSGEVIITEEMERSVKEAISGKSDKQIIVTDLDDRTPDREFSPVSKPVKEETPISVSAATITSKDPSFENNQKSDEKPPGLKQKDPAILVETAPDPIQEVVTVTAEKTSKKKHKKGKSKRRSESPHPIKNLPQPVEEQIVQKVLKVTQLGQASTSKALPVDDPSSNTSDDVTSALLSEDASRVKAEPSAVIAEEKVSPTISGETSDLIKVKLPEISAHLTPEELVGQKIDQHLLISIENIGKDVVTDLGLKPDAVSSDADFSNIARAPSDVRSPIHDESAPLIAEEVLERNVGQTTSEAKVKLIQDDLFKQPSAILSSTEVSQVKIGESPADDSSLIHNTSAPLMVDEVVEHKGEKATSEAQEPRAVLQPSDPISKEKITESAVDVSGPVPDPSICDPAVVCAPVVVDVHTPSQHQPSTLETAATVHIVAEIKVDQHVL